MCIVDLIQNTIDVMLDDGDGYDYLMQFVNAGTLKEKDAGYIYTRACESLGLFN